VHRIARRLGPAWLASLVFGLAPAHAAPVPRPGSAGAGDRLFPGLGNGGYDVRQYKLALTYPTSEPQQTISGRVTLRARATQSLSRFNLDFAGDTVSAVRVNDAPADFLHVGEELEITPRRQLRDGRGFHVKVDFISHVAALPPQNPLPSGWFTTPAGSITAAQPDRAHDIFPANDHPGDKSSYRFRLDVPAGVTAVANGVLTGRHTRGGRTVWAYRQRHPMASQLIQLAVGDLDVVPRGRARGVPLRGVTARSVTDAVEPALARTPDHLAWLVDRVGRYPFDVYGLLVTDRVLIFALETQTLSLHSRFLFDTFGPAEYEPIMLHELAHQWFGDSVAIETWSDLWLSEGHATWYEQTYSEEAFGTDFVAFIRNAYENGDRWRADFGPVALPARSDLRLFSPNVYDGGALVLYALRQVIGDRTFRELERRWARSFAGESAGTEDFLAFASKVAHRDLTAFLREWLYGTKTPPMPGHPDWTTNPLEGPQGEPGPPSQAPSARALEHAQGLARR
jgi:aminopeptidase N